MDRRRPNVPDNQKRERRNAFKKIEGKFTGNGE